MTFTKEKAVKTHNLKIWPEHFVGVRDGLKRAELRFDDRDYQAGDILDLCEWDPNEEAFTGEYISVTVTHVAEIGECMPGYVLLSIAAPKPLTTAERAELENYRNAQQVVPDVLPCPVKLEPGMRFGKGIRTEVLLGALQRRAKHLLELDAMTPEQRAEHDAGVEEFKAMLSQAGHKVEGGDDGRDQFEEWMLKKWGRSRQEYDFLMGKFLHGDNYADSYTRHMWKAWAASRAAMQSGAVDKT